MWTLTGCKCSSSLPEAVSENVSDDSAAHISEEVAGARRSAPIAIILGVASTEILGWLLLITASFATKSVSSLLATNLPLPMGQLFLDVLGKRGMLAVWSLIIVVQVRRPSYGSDNCRFLTARHQFVTGAAQGVDASRVVFAFARDNALPESRWWKQMNQHTQTPVNAVWFVMVSAAICGLLGFSAAALSSLAGSVSFFPSGLGASALIEVFLFPSRFYKGVRDRLVRVVCDAHLSPDYFWTERTLLGVLYARKMVHACWHNRRVMGHLHRCTPLVPGGPSNACTRHE